MNTAALGRKGEDIAVDYLVEKGYRILARNYIHNKKEIDIIAQDKNEIVFVEVKERNTNYFEEPYQAVNIQKQKHIIMVANYYILRNHIDLEARFDIISIIMPFMSKPTIEHIQNAFTAML